MLPLWLLEETQQEVEGGGDEEEEEEEEGHGDDGGGGGCCPIKQAAPRLFQLTNASNILLVVAGPAVATKAVSATLFIKALPSRCCGNPIVALSMVSILVILYFVF